VYRLLRHPRYRRASRVHDWVARHVFDRTLWQPDERRVAAGVAAGLFLCMVPIPLQMFAGAAVAIRFRWNIPSAVLACWVTSPVTWPVTYLPAWLLGLHLTGTDPAVIRDLGAFDLGALVSYASGHSWSLVAAGLAGCLTVGAALAVLGYVITRSVYFVRRIGQPRRVAT
jgi:uncharacterized protein (DUF2062 family)